MSATQLALFEASPTDAEVDAGTQQLADGGLAHFRNLMRRYAESWPYCVPEWQAWIAYYEPMKRHGYAAAEALKPRDEECEPSRLLAACMRKTA